MQMKKRGSGRWSQSMLTVIATEGLDNGLDSTEAHIGSIDHCDDPGGLGVTDPGPHLTGGVSELSPRESVRGTQAAQLTPTSESPAVK